MDDEQLPPQHQVFINFRGKELRNNFIGHLERSLEASGINFFMDTKERKGEDIRNIFKRIQESRIALVVFSSMYTESEWCLDELMKIKECVDLGRLEVLPIFYKIETVHVKQLKGKFGDNFRDQEWQFRSQSQKIEKWKAALESISGKIGLTLTESSSEADFLESINEVVLKMLGSISAITRPHNSISAITRPHNFQVNPFHRQGRTYSAQSTFSNVSGREASNLLTRRNHTSVQSCSSSSEFSDNYSVCSYSVATSSNGGPVSATSRVWYSNPETGTTTSNYFQPMEDITDDMNAHWPSQRFLKRY